MPARPAPTPTSRQSAPVIPSCRLNSERRHTVHSDHTCNLIYPLALINFLIVAVVVSQLPNSSGPWRAGHLTALVVVLGS